MRFSSSIANYFNIKKYNDDYFKLTFIKNYHYDIKEYKNIEDKEEDKEEDNEEDNEEDKEEDNEEEFKKLSNNLSRAKGKIFEYAMCNEFEYFITLTLDSKKYDRDNLSLYVKNLGQFIRDTRKKYNCKIEYILIPERHLDGAWHMHGLIKGIPNSELSINKNGYLDWLGYSKRFGYCSISKVKNHVAVSKYITKYISKSFNDSGGVVEENKKLYYNTRGLKISSKLFDGQIEEEAFKKMDFDFSNQYVSIKDLNKSQFIEFCKMLEF